MRYLEKEVSQTPKKSNKTLVIISIVFIVLVLLGIVGRIIQRRIAQSGGEINLGSNKVTYKSNEGDFTFEEGGKLPSGFPSDFPVYPGARLTSSWTAGGENSKGTSVVWESSDAVSKITDYYQKELVVKGWKITATFNQGDSATYSFEKDKVSGFVGVAKGDSGKSDISATIGEK